MGLTCCMGTTTKPLVPLRQIDPYRKEPASATKNRSESPISSSVCQTKARSEIVISCPIERRARKRQRNCVDRLDHLAWQVTKTRAAGVDYIPAQTEVKGQILQSSPCIININRCIARFNVRRIRKLLIERKSRIPS